MSNLYSVKESEVEITETMWKDATYINCITCILYNMYLAS